MGTLGDSGRVPPWQRFVLEHGWRAVSQHLAHVLGQPEESILQVRRTGACCKLDARKDFVELFSLWHGRPPEEADWPVPRKWEGRGEYEWQAPEVALLATLVGQLSVPEIAATLTARLQARTKDAAAVRTNQAVQVRINKIGMQAADVVGGITVAKAAREIGSLASVQHAIDSKQLPARRVGRLWVIPHDNWANWKEVRTFPPKGYLLLTSLKEPLAIKSDKLSEFARMGYVPTAVRCNPFGKGPNTRFGTWYISPAAAKKLLADRRTGKPMPWHGKPLMDNLNATFKLWEKRKHPTGCQTCAGIWGKAGAPSNLEEYVQRYPALAHGAKRHLTMPWTPGLTLDEVAKQSKCKRAHVLQAIANGALASSQFKGRTYVSRTDATRWIARHCPLGDGRGSWVSLDTARKLYLFTLPELRDHIAAGTLKSKTGENGPMRGVVYVPRQQCVQLRETIGFTEKEAARRLGITVPRLRVLLQGVDWREAEHIPLVTLRAVERRIESREGYDLDEAAAALGTSPEWVKARVDDGTVRVIQARWDRRRRYLTEPMMRRLRQAMAAPTQDVVAEQTPGELTLGQAAIDAGVSTATVLRWAEDDEVTRRQGPRCWLYQQRSLRARARRYWKTVRFHRATRPAWLGVEATHTQRKAA